jgi:hypothetical protein
MKKMNTTDYISFMIDRMPKGHIFTYSDLKTDVTQKEAAIKALNRMVASGKMAKLSRGRYYKPEITPFGTIQPDRTQVVKDLLKAKGKTVGYLTGYSIYNQLGLTTQVGNTIQIGKNEIRPSFKRERYTISFIKQKNTITKENIPMLQILDAIRYIKKIPDASPESSARRLMSIIKKYSDEETDTLVRLALKYPPATRALLGAFLEQLNREKAAAPLLKSLNPFTKYRLAWAAKAITAAEKWNIS